jgi:hypothetical protein
MRVTGAEGFGVMVDVRLHGDLQRRLGEGGLRRAALAVTLHSTAGPASSITVLTRGAAVRDQRVLRAPGQAEGVAVRTGRTVRVFMRTPGFATLESVEAVTFARAAVAADTMGLPLDPEETTPEIVSCDEGEHLYDGIGRALDGATKLVFRLERFEFELRSALRRATSEGRRHALRRSLRDVRATHAAAREQRGLLLAVGGDGEELLGERCYQPSLLP